MTSAELIRIVHAFYPTDLWPTDPGYDTTPEVRRRVEATRRAAAEYPRWRALLDRLRPRYGLHDRSLHILGGSVDAAYTVELWVPAKDEEDGRIDREIGSSVGLELHVSFLGPYYMILHPDTADPKDLEDVGRHVETVYHGYRPVPPEIGDQVVPGVALDTVAPGRATIGQCLLSTHWPGSPSELQEEAREPVQSTVTPEAWALAGYERAWICIAVLLRGLAQGAADLGIDQSAWDNTFAVALWAMTEKRAGRALHEVDRDITEEDINLVRRLAALGSAVLGGEERTPELRRLAEQCMDRHTMRSLPAWDWRQIIERLPPGVCDALLPADDDRPEYVTVFEGDTCFCIPKCFYDVWRTLELPTGAPPADSALPGGAPGVT